MLYTLKTVSRVVKKTGFTISLLATTMMLNAQTSDTLKAITEILKIEPGIGHISADIGIVSTPYLFQTVDFLNKSRLNQGRMTEPIELIQGKVAGVNISKSGGDPNLGFDVSIRGVHSFLEGQRPLYVIDGIVGLDPSILSPDDIASFTILKDVASTALYGTQGVNGVIVITTHQNESGLPFPTKKLYVEYNNYFSTDRVANQYDLLSANEVREYAATNNSPNFIDAGANTNWMDELYSNAFSQNHYLATTLRLENTVLRATYNYNQLGGTLLGTDRNRHNAGIAASHSAFDGKLVLRANAAGMLQRSNLVNYTQHYSQNPIYQAVRRTPTDPVYNQDGTFFESTRNFQYYNPIAMIEQTLNEANQNQLMANIAADYQFTDHWKLAVSGSTGATQQSTWYAEPADAFSNRLPQGIAAISNRQGSFNYLQQTINYQNIFNQKHQIHGTVGHSYYIRKDSARERFSTETQFTIADNTTAAMLEDISYPTDLRFRSGQESIHAGFTQLNYGYEEKYLLTANVRLDHFTRESLDPIQNISWGVNGTWNVLKETIIPKIKALSTLQLSASRGRTANLAVPIVIRNGNMADNALDPETLNETTISLIFGLFNDKITANVTAYKRVSEDVITKIYLPSPPNPITFYNNNGASISNRGLEITIDAYILNKPKLKWYSSLNLAHNTQVIEDLGSNAFGIREQFISGRGIVGGNSFIKLLEEGQSTGSFYLPVYSGQAADGTFLYEADNGGVTRDVTRAPRRHVGSALPKIVAGWSNHFKLYKHFDVSFSLRGVFGHTIYNGTRMVFENTSDLPSLNTLSSALSDEVNTDDPAISDFYLESGDFIRLDNLAVGYTLKRYKRKVRLYLSGNNLITWTNFTGLDPEQNFSSATAGLDLHSTYARYRNIAIGIQCNL